jgi:hypothetical protein
MMRGGSAIPAAREKVPHFRARRIYCNGTHRFAVGYDLSSLWDWGWPFLSRIDFFAGARCCA